MATRHTKTSGKPAASQPSARNTAGTRPTANGERPRPRAAKATLPVALDSPLAPSAAAPEITPLTPIAPASPASSAIPAMSAPAALSAASTSTLPAAA